MKQTISVINQKWKLNIVSYYKPLTMHNQTHLIIVKINILKYKNLILRIFNNFDIEIENEV